MPDEFQELITDEINRVRTQLADNEFDDTLDGYFEALMWVKREYAHFLKGQKLESNT